MNEVIIRKTDSFRSKKDKRRYVIFFILFLLLSIIATIGLIVYKNPVKIGSVSFYPVIRRRLTAVIAMAIAAMCQSISTIAFQTVASNRIITPSLLGFEALYSTIQTSTLFFFGVSALVAFKGLHAFLIQVILMVLLTLILYSWILKDTKNDMHFMLLVGMILGGGLRSASSFMRRILSPSEFDILQARLFSSVNNVDREYFPIVIPLVIIVSIYIFKKYKSLNVISLGHDISINLGNDHKKESIKFLVSVSILMAISTALIGPLSFFGFLVATLTYQIANTYDHKYLLAMSIVLGFMILTVAYFIMNHIFSAQGVVSIIIEFFGAIAFIFMIFRKEMI